MANTLDKCQHKLGSALTVAPLNSTCRGHLCLPLVTRSPRSRSAFDLDVMPFVLASVVCSRCVAACPAVEPGRRPLGGLPGWAVVKLRFIDESGKNPILVQRARSHPVPVRVPASCGWHEYAVMTLDRPYPRVPTCSSRQRP
jgi:hypothetical protein